MEFSEKLQELRKQRGLTQEALAQALFVSRTAVSKWESGRGYPGIDSIKAISKYFSVSIDDLLSSDELIDAAAAENAENLRRLCELSFSAADLMALALALLPLYPVEADGHVASVSLAAWTQPSPAIRAVCWALFAALFAMGAAGVILNRLKAVKGRRAVPGASMALGAVTVLFLTMTRAPYAVTVAFLLLSVKAALVYRMPKVPLAQRGQM